MTNIKDDAPDKPCQLCGGAIMVFSSAQAERNELPYLRVCSVCREIVRGDAPDKQMLDGIADSR